MRVSTGEWAHGRVSTDHVNGPLHCLRRASEARSAATKRIAPERSDPARQYIGLVCREASRDEGAEGSQVTQADRSPRKARELRDSEVSRDLTLPTTPLAIPVPKKMTCAKACHVPRCRRGRTSTADFLSGPPAVGLPYSMPCPSSGRTRRCAQDVPRCLRSRAVINVFQGQRGEEVGVARRSGGGHPVANA